MFLIVITAFVASLSFGFCDNQLFAQLAVTEVSSANNLGEDWYELTNTSDAIVNLNGFFWDDDPIGENDGAVFGDFSLEPGESLIVLEGSEEFDGIETLFRDTYSVDASLQILTEDDFTGNDTFSGLSSGGDQISLYDTDPNVSGSMFNLIDFVEFPAAPEELVDPAFGATFDFTQLDADGIPTLSVSGTNGAITALNGDVGSPGVVTVTTDPKTEEPLIGDVNGDGEVTFLDIGPFVTILSTSGFSPEADIDMSGIVDFLDIAPFIAILTGS